MALVLAIELLHDAPHGEVYTFSEYKAFLETAGFTLRKIVPFYYPVAVIKHFDLTVRNNILYDWLLIATKR